MEAVIFDFDGVIVDSEKYWDKEMELFGHAHIPGWQAGDNAKHLTGLNRKDAFEKISKIFGNVMPYEQFSGHIQKLQDDIHYTYAQLIPEVERVLFELHTEKIPIGIASSSAYKGVRHALWRLRILHVFSVISTGDKVPVGEGKPKPTIYLKAAEELGIDPSSCIAIEDSLHGLTAAKAANITCIGLRNGFNDAQDLSNADHILEGYSDVTIQTLQNMYHLSKGTSH